MIGIEFTDARPTHAARSARNGEHVGILGHRREGRVRIFEHEFRVGVLLPGANIVCWSGVSSFIGNSFPRRTRCDGWEAGIINDAPPAILGDEWRTWAGTERSAPALRCYASPSVAGARSLRLARAAR